MVYNDLLPKEGIPSVGKFYKYPGGKDSSGNVQYIWELPKLTRSASLTLVAQDDLPINITGMTVKCFRGILYGEQ